MKINNDNPQTTHALTKHWQLRLHYFWENLNTTRSLNTITTQYNSYLNRACVS